MKLLDENTISNELLEIKDCNFVAHAITPWHANGVEACIEFFRQKGVRLNGKVYLCRHNTTGKCISARNFYRNYGNISFEEVEFKNKSWKEKIYSFLLTYKNILTENRQDGEYFYVFNTSYPDFNWVNIIKRIFPEKKVVFVVVDEGAGSYLFMNVGSWVSMHSDGNKRGPAKFLEQFELFALGYLRIKPRQFLTSYFLKRGRYYDNRILIENADGKLVPNDDIVGYYNQVFALCRNTFLSTNSYVYRNKILLNTQCLTEDGMINDGQDLVIYEEVLSVASTLGIPVVVKYHPREKNIQRYKQYPCFIDERKSLSQEVLVGENDKPMVIIGIYTSSLVTLKTFYDIPSISLAKLFLNTNISDELRRLLNTFIDTYNGLIGFPCNHEELVHMIDEVANQNK